MRFLHIFPAGLWSLIAPLQLSERFRSKNRTAHRYLGRFFVAMSMSIGIGLIPLVQMDKDRPVRSTACFEEGTQNDRLRKIDTAAPAIRVFFPFFSL